MNEPVLVSGNRETYFPELFKQRGYKIGVEIGVYRGVFSAHLLENVSGLKMYGVDPWVPYKGFHSCKQHKIDTIYEDAMNRMKGLDCEIIRKKSIDAVNDFEDGSVDFVYIDGNHDFWHVATDIALWVPKVRDGGVVSGHDYIDTSRCKVRSVVQAYTEAHKISPWYVIVGSDRSPSWYWKKK